MKKIIIGLALGALAGMMVGEIPEVKSFIKQGKKKVKNLMD